MWASRVMIVIKNVPPRVGDLGDLVGSLGHKDPIEEKMATNSSFLFFFMTTKNFGSVSLLGHT